MSSFTVVSFYSPQLNHYAPQLKSDCDRIGYRCHLQAVASFDNLLSAFRYKIQFLRRCVEEFDEVLWLDIECRILQPLPADWTSPLVSTFRIGRRHGWSAGVLKLDSRHRRLLLLWQKYAERHQQLPDDFVLEFLARELGLAVSTADLGYYDRDTTAPIVRGEWSNRHTVLLHPTTNRWTHPNAYAAAFAVGQPVDASPQAAARKRKHLFFRNFAGDFSEIDHLMRSPSVAEFSRAGWRFEPGSGTFAPEAYWPRQRENYFCKPMGVEQSRRGFLRAPARLRRRAIARLRLDPAEAEETSDPARETSLLGRLQRLLSTRPSEATGQ